MSDLFSNQALKDYRRLSQREQMNSAEDVSKIASRMLAIIVNVVVAGKDEID